MLGHAELIANKKPIGPMLLHTIQEKDVAAAVRQYHELRDRQPEAFDFAESQLNDLGYQLMGMKRLKDAIRILQLNVEAYPESANAYDSLGEVYMEDGSKTLAIENYKKSLQLDPKNDNAVRRLKQLNGP
jgi:tetratricopeptide (TPR) repeat protein